MGAVQRVRQVISELIGNARRTINVMANRIWSHRPSFDWNRVDYAFYDRLWRGQAIGLEKSGLIVKPITNKITEWTLGQAPEIVIAEDEALQADVNDWWDANQATILKAHIESSRLGDSFLVMTGDGSLTVIPPDIVYPIVDEQDYSKIIGWRVHAVHPHPENASTMTIIDEYYADRRVRILKRDGAEISTETFRNPLGRIPVVHIPGAGGGSNDKFGRPEVEPLLPLLHDYGQLLDAGMDGNYRQGRPVFAMNFGSTKELNDFWDRYGEVNTRTLPDGTTESTEYLDVDLEGIVTFANATGDFKSPGSSSQDTMNYLQILYYLIVEHTEMPEFLLGSAIQGSKASAETQMPPFVKFIELRQKLSEGWVKDVVDLAIAYLRAVRIRRTAAKLMVKVIWPTLTDDDHRLTLDTLKWAYAAGLIDDENAVRLMPLEIDDPDAMLAKLKAQAAQAARDNGDDFDAAMNADARQDEGEEVPDAQMWGYTSSMDHLLLEQYEDTVMIGLRIPIETADVLASAARRAGIVPVDPMTMHITLAYLGKIDELPVSRSSLLETLARFGDSADVISGVIGGLGRFNASNSSDGKDVLYASFDSPSLAAMRERLVEMIEAAGATVSKAHGFTPHVTLSYVERGSATPNLQIDTMPLGFDKITAYYGIDEIDIPLRYRASQNGRYEDRKVIA